MTELVALVCFILLISPAVAYYTIRQKHRIARERELERRLGNSPVSPRAQAAWMSPKDEMTRVLARLSTVPWVGGYPQRHDASSHRTADARYPGAAGGGHLYLGALANRPSYVPAIAHLALSALALISEGAASLRAIPVLEQRSNWPRHAATLAVAFGTYAIPAFTPLAMTAVKRHLESADTIPMVSRRGTCQNTRGQYGRG